MGGTREIQSEDPSTQLTYTALTGVRKQSVEDVERLFGLGVIEFMEKKGYHSEAQHLRVVRDWRRAVDERGLSSEQRRQYRKKLLDYLLDDLMPWHSAPGLQDFSLLEVNRYGYCIMHSPTLINYVSCNCTYIIHFYTTHSCI